MSNMKRLLEEYPLNRIPRKVWEGELYPYRPIRSMDTVNEVSQGMELHQPRHDGRLDDRGACHVFYTKVAGKTGIFIENELDWLEDEMRLDPKQALSLLAWLEQEKDKLVQLAKE